MNKDNTYQAILLSRPVRPFRTKFGLSLRPSFAIPSRLLRYTFALLLLLVVGVNAAWGDGYYALHQNGKGYLRVSGEKNANLTNDGNFRYGNIFDDNGSSLWVITSDGYLKNNYFYLNVANNSTLYLSVDPVTQWTLEDIGGQTKKHVKINDGANDLYLCNDNNTIKLANSPSSYYNACPITLNEVSWSGPSTSDLTLQSPQLITYLRGYFTQKFNYSFVNDADATVSESNKDRRVYATYNYTSGGSNKGTEWDITSDGIIYNLKASGNVAVTATYGVLPADPIALASHSTPSSVSRKFTIQQKALSPTANMDYLLFSIKGGDDYRYPYDDGIAQDNPVKANGKGGTTNASVLTDPLNDGSGRNQQISWKITTDDAGFCMFQNTSTGRYLYFYEPKSTSGSFGELRVGATTLPTDATLSQYKFRLYKTSTTDNSTCYFIIPYSKLFAIYKSDGIASDIYASLNITDYKTDNTIRLFKSNDNSKWCIYKYEAEYRVRTDFTFSGPASTDAAGNVTFTSSDGWYGKYIKESPKDGGGQRGLVVSGSYNTNKVNYIWTVIGLDDYIDHTDWTTDDGGYVKTIENNKTFTFNVTSLPVSTASGTIQLQLRGGEEDKNSTTNPYKWSGKKTLGFTILGNGTVEFTEISSLSEITSSGGAYRLTGNASGTPGVSSFSGILDGNGYTISGLTAPLFTTLNNGTVRNLNVSGVSIASHAGPTGAIAGTANGGSRIYNVGILDGSVGSSGVCGGLVGVLDGSARVVNCFSYANITNGTTVGGIVGENEFATTTADMRTMVMNCMFYGDIIGGTSKAPIYNGKIITNRSDQSGVSNFNYFWADASYVQNRHIDVYNCALSAETRFLQRFEFFRHMLNSNRALAAWWATGSRDNQEEMMKWVLEPSQIGTATPYPILKKQGYYPSVVNNNSATTSSDNSSVIDYTESTAPETPETIKTLSVTLSGEGITTTSLTLPITDKDPNHFNFNYHKVQLPYFNDVGTGNYTNNKVVTGWEITVSGGANSFSTGSDASASVTDGDITLTTPYNFADRKSTQKDNYANSGRIFNQGAYYDVPEGVTSISIKPHWAKCVYVSDAYPDVVYNQDMGGATNVTTVGGGERYKNDNYYTINGSSQKVYTSMGNAVNALNPSGSVYDNAIVLVGNVHSLSLSSEASNKPYTIMSIDLDNDNEPDYSYILRFDGRKRVHPVRSDFLNIIGLGMAQKSNGGKGTYNFGIMQPYGWFEATNTSLFRVTQLEYDMSGRTNSPIILHGGVIEQWVTYAQNGSEANAVQYYHVGGNVWFKEFHIGQHQDRTEANAYSPHPPISVTGGDFEEFYLTGLYNTPTNNYDDNAECYINGGRFNKVAGTGMQGIGHATNHTNGNIIWQIDNADINEFYAGGTNAAHKAEGNIWTIISNSRVDLFCGGPKFGDMNADKKVVTNATNCTFRAFFGAGYGGNSYNRRYPSNQNSKININWNAWVQGNDGLQYRYNSTYGGVETRIDYQFLPMSSNTNNVCRLFVDYVSFSLATTRDVTSKLTGCTITKSPLGTLDLFEGCIGNFYGGGSLGKVDGPVNSTLINCTVEGSAFGAGYSATLPTVAVMNNSFQTEPHYDENLGAYLDAVYPTTETYTWQHADVVNSTATAINTTNHILYTTEDLTTLGTVTGDATLHIEGTTSVGGSVFGGGEESDVLGNTNVTMTDGYVFNGIFGGGYSGSVGTFTRSTAEGDVNVYGHTAHEGCIGKPVSCAANTGKCTVVVTGGQIGPIEVATEGMTRPAAEGGPVPEGWIWGGGCGLVQDPATHPDMHFTAYVNETDVTIGGTAFILESIIGGGEFGRVLGNTHVTIQDQCQIGVGKDMVANGKPVRYTEEQFVNPLITPITNANALAECSHFDYGYIDPDGDGKPVYLSFDQYYDKYYDKTTGIFKDNVPEEFALGSTSHPSDGKTWIGCVFGGGSGYMPCEKEDGTGYEWGHSAGWVGGNTLVEIKGGHILTNVYGANEYTNVEGTSTVKMSGGTIGVPRTLAQIKKNPLNGNLFGAGKGDPRTHFNKMTNVASTEVEVTGGIIYGSVYGGGEDGHVLGNAVTTIGKETTTAGVTTKTGPVIGCNNTASNNGNVFGGGQGATTALTAGVVGGNVTVNILGGTINGSVYGGGELASVGTHFAMTTETGYGVMQEGTNHGRIDVNLTGGTVEQNVYGGCMGTTENNLLGISKNVTVNLNGKAADDVVADNAMGCAVVGSIFGCNNVNSSPEGTVTVHIYGTQHAGKSQIANTNGETPVTDAKTKGSYDVTAVYGGGNMAAYVPKNLTTGTTNVIIDGCGRTSIQYVYGGGNAASTPATKVSVNGTYEIEELFGGGNGKDSIVVNNVKKANPGANVGFKDYSAVEGTYDTKEKRQTGEFINNYVYGTGQASVNVFGGTIHRVFGGSNTKGNVRQTAVTLLEEAGGCDFCVDEAYGGGKSAPMDAEAKLLMACIPGLKEVYGGAEAADVHGNVTLNITNGTFDRVFGGNNLSGTINGSITVNVEEVGCKPIMIGELYGGGNLAGYSVYGYNDDGSLKESGTTPLYADPQVNVKSFTSIGNIYGGGYGAGATMVGNPTVNVNVAYGRYYNDNKSVISKDSTTTNNYPIPSHAMGKIGAINNVFGGGNAAKVIGSTTVNIATLSEVSVIKDLDAGTYETKDVIGADIRGDVYGGGNNAEVTGSSNVNIGKKQTTN